MYEELVKNLRFCGKCNDAMECDYCEYDNTTEYVDRDCSDRLMLQAADAIEELQKQVEDYECRLEISPEAEYAIDKHCNDIIFRMDKLIKGLDDKPRWIPVTERLPDEYVSVLCYCSRNGQYGCGEWCKEDNGTIYWTGLNGMIPTHWQPLPKPPKEET